MWVYLFVTFLVLYSLYKERQNVGCPSLPTMKDCQNQNGKPVLGTKGTVNDTVDELLRKIDYGAAYSDRWVIWRIPLLCGIIGTIITFYLLHKRFPTEFELVVGTISFGSVAYFARSYYKFHLQNVVRDNIQHNVLLLFQKMA